MGNQEGIKLQKGLAVAFDFDGVIHKYSKGWQNGSIYDKENEQVIALMEKLSDDGIPVMIISTREPRQIVEWWKQHLEFALSAQEIPDDVAFYNNVSCVGVTNRKLPAQLYIDDRAFSYHGQDFEELKKELSLK